MPKPAYPRSAFFQKLRGTHPLVTMLPPSKADEALLDFLVEAMEYYANHRLN
jgi:hypothetical protein